MRCAVLALSRIIQQSNRAKNLSQCFLDHFPGRIFFFFAIYLLENSTDCFQVEKSTESPFLAIFDDDLYVSTDIWGKKTRGAFFGQNP